MRCKKQRNKHYLRLYPFSNNQDIEAFTNPQICKTTFPELSFTLSKYLRILSRKGKLDKVGFRKKESLLTGLVSPNQYQ